MFNGLEGFKCWIEKANNAAECASAKTEEDDNDEGGGCTGGEIFFGYICLILLFFDVCVDNY